MRHPGGLRCFCSASTERRTRDGKTGVSHTLSQQPKFYPECHTDLNVNSCTESKRDERGKERLDRNRHTNIELTHRDDEGSNYIWDVLETLKKCVEKEEALDALINEERQYYKEVETLLSQLQMRKHS